MDSGVETGNESNDSSVVQQNAADTTQENQRTEYSIVPRECKLLSSENAVANVEYNFSVTSDVQTSKIFSMTGRRLSQSPSLVSLVQALKPQPRMSSMVIEFPAHDIIPHDLCPKMKRRIVSKTHTFSPLRSASSIITRVQNRQQEKLASAVSTNNTELVEKLLNEGVYANTADGLGRTPLHIAASRGYTEIVKLLLAHNANPNVKDKVGNTPLHLAAVTSKTEIVNLLLKAGTNVLSLDEFGNNPLDLARTKLRVLQRCRECVGLDLNDIKDDVKKVIEMLKQNRLNLLEQKATSEQVETLSAICSRLTLSNSSDQIEDDLKNLLDNLDSLTLKK